MSTAGVNNDAFTTATTTTPTPLPRYVEPEVTFSPSSPSDLARLSAHLHARGFAVVRGALSAEECSEALKLTWDWQGLAHFPQQHLFCQNSFE
jgi:hypothetical protein